MIRFRRDRYRHESRRTLPVNRLSRHCRWKTGGECSKPGLRSYRLCPRNALCRERRRQPPCGSIPARDTACRMAWPASVGDFVQLKAPRNAQPIGVRAVDTKSAFVNGKLPLRVRQADAALKVVEQQGARDPRTLPGTPDEMPPFARPLAQDDLVCVEQGATAVGREPIAIPVDKRRYPTPAGRFPQREAAAASFTSASTPASDNLLILHLPSDEPDLL